MPSSHDRQITIFSPEGKLYQIEYAIKAVSNAGILCLGFKGADTVCVVCPKKVSEKLMDKDCVTNLYKITPKIGALCVGSVPDCKVVVMQARQMAAKFKDANGYDMPVHFLAQKIGKKAQIFTQHAGVRPLACTVHLCAVDDEKGPQLWKIDPSGHCMGWKAVATGPKDQEAANMLEKIIKKVGEKASKAEVIQKTIDCLQLVLAQDLKQGDLEVGVVSGVDGEFQVLTEAEVEQHLTAIHEQD